MVLELRDARIPYSSANKVLDEVSRSNRSSSSRTGSCRGSVMVVVVVAVVVVMGK